MPNNIKEGGLRRLISGEVKLTKSVLGSTLQYHKVWIYRDSYLPFNLQDPDTAMTPDGEIYFRNQYRDDFSQTLFHYQHLLIHEMSHVRQREKGMNVICRGLVSWLVSYRYKLDGRPLSEYPMEQQVQIIANGFILQKSGHRTWLDMRFNHNITLNGDIHESVIRESYRSTLQGFPWR